MSVDVTPSVAGVGEAEGVAPPPRRRFISPLLGPRGRETGDDVPTELAQEEATDRAEAWVPILLGAVLVVGLLVRLSAAEHLSPQIDEAASVMAARMVVERGLPIFPSDIPYFQGATLSYLLAPFVWLGYGDLADLKTMRWISAIAGVAALYFTYRLGREIARSAWPAVLAAGLLALDPISIQWSGHVRMYALLQALAALLVWLYAIVLLRGPSRRLLAGVVIVFWLGVFTHVATALLWPAMALLALAKFGRTLRRERRDVAAALLLCSGAPVLLFALNKLLGPSDRAVSKSVPFLSFVGDHLLSISRVLDPTYAAWELLFDGGALADVMPYVVVLLSGLLVGRRLLARHDGDDAHRMRLGIGLALAAYWLPVLLVGTFTNEPQERYVIHIQPLGFIVVALAARELIEWRPAGVLDERTRVVVARVAGALALLITALHLGSSLYRLTNRTVIDPDYVDAARYVAARRQSDERVIVGLTPPAYLALGGREGLIFVAGPKDSKRAERYTRQTGEETYVDYWAGVPAYVTPKQLCDTLLTYPDTWLILDTQRIRANWAFAGAMADVMTGLTYEVYKADGGAVVRRVAPAPSRNPKAVRVCEAEAEGAPTVNPVFDDMRPPGGYEPAPAGS